ncbi:MAG: uracil-DNA glycosylase [Halobacteriota archaeon]
MPAPTTYPDEDSRTVVEAGCTRCPVLAESRTQIAWGNGPDDAAVLVVGEAPGAGDPTADEWRGGNHTGLAYTSRHSGRRIRTLMDELGYGDRAYYTNAVKCFPAADGGETNREPTSDELATCRRHLLAELEEIDPSAVLATGKHATESILAAEGERLTGFLDSVLTPIRCPTLGTTVLPVLHPSYQDVWRARLGYDADDYRDAVGAALDALVDD